jgi:hypothetical protein
MTFLARLDGYWRAPAPASRLAMLRILTGLFAWIYVSARIVHFADYTRFDAAQFRPIGVVSVASAPLPPEATWGLAVATAIAGGAFTLGWRHRLSGPLFAALLLWVTTYRSSWGMIFHTENLMVLHVLVLAIAPAADAWALGARGSPGERRAGYGWPIKLLCAVTLTTYFVAGIAKLRETGLAWVTTDFLRNYVAYDALRKVELGSIHSPLGAWLAGQAWVWKPLAAFSLLVELAAPLAMASARAARAWVIAAIAFHLGVLAMMAIFFPYVALGLGFASFFEVERLGGWLRRQRGRVAPRENGRKGTSER